LFTKVSTEKHALLTN